MRPRKLTNYKKYRVILAMKNAQYIIAASNTVNNLVILSKAWFHNTTEGQYLDPDITGYVVLQELDALGNYVNSEKAPFEGKANVIGALRELGGRS